MRPDADKRLTDHAEQLARDIHTTEDPIAKLEKRGTLMEHVVLGVPINSHREGGLINDMHELKAEQKTTRAQLTKLLIGLQSLTVLVTAILDRMH